MIKRTGLLVLLVSLFFSTAAYADEYVAGEAIVSYSRIDGQGELYNPSDPSAKAAERVAFCDCVLSIANPINPSYHYFGSCTPIHPVLPNLPQSFITNHLLNEAVVHVVDTNHVNFSNFNNFFQASASCTDTFSIEYSVANYKYETDLANASSGDPWPGGTTAGAGPGDVLDQYYHDLQWALHDKMDNAVPPRPSNINAPGAWFGPNGTTGDGQTIVAVIDTGIDYNHPDFTRQDLTSSIWTNPGEIPNNSVDDDGNGKIDDVHGWNFVEDNKELMDTYGHGTEIAGVIAAAMNNGTDGTTGIAGVCPKCKIMPLKVASNFPDDLGIKRAIIYARLMGADVINMSFFKRRSTAFPDPYAFSAPELQTAYQDGIVLVACAGNYHGNLIQAQVTKLAYPAAYGYPGSADEGFDVIAVAATDTNNKRAKDFNCVFQDVEYTDSTCTTIFGGWIDISAPGKDILSTVPVGLSDTSGDPLYDCAHPSGNPAHPGYCSAGGSSFSAAYVSAVAALIKSENPVWLSSPLPNSRRCGPGKDEPCFHDFVRELIKQKAQAFATSPAPDVNWDASGDFGAGLLDAGAAVMGAVPNQAPEWNGVFSDGFGAGTPEDPVRLHSNKEARFDVMFNDPDGDPLTVTMQAGPLLQRSILDGTKFSWAANQSDMLNPLAMVGYYDLRFTADDGRGGVIQGPLIPIAIPTNHSPYFLSALPANIEVHLGDLVDFTLSASDQDKDPVTFHPGYICNAVVHPEDPISCFPLPLPANSTLVAVRARTPQARFTWRPTETDTCVDGVCPLNMLSFYASDRGPVVFDENGQLVDDPIINPAARLTDGDGTWIQVTATNEAPLIDPGLPSTFVVNGTTQQLNFNVNEPHHDNYDVTSSALPTGGSLTRSGDTFTLAFGIFPKTTDLQMVITATDSFTDPTTGQIYPGMSSQKTVTLDFDTSRPYAYSILPSNNSCTTNKRLPFSATVTDDRGLSGYTLKLYRGVRVQNGQVVTITFPEPPLYTKSESLSGRGPAYVNLTPSADLSLNILHRYTYRFNDAQGNFVSGSRDFTVTTNCGGGKGVAVAPAVVEAPQS